MAVSAIRRPPGRKSARLKLPICCLALSVLLIGASTSALAYKKHNLYLMSGLGDYSREVSLPDTASLIDEEIELYILGYGHRFSEEHEVVFYAAQSKIKEASQKTSTRNYDDNGNPTQPTTGDKAVDIDLLSLSLLYKPQLPLDSGSATFYGLLGFTRSTINPDGAKKEHENDFSLGLGWSFRVLSSLELQVEYLRFFGEGNKDDDEGKPVKVSSQESKPRHALSSLNFGIVFKF